MKLLYLTLAILCLLTSSCYNWIPEKADLPGVYQRTYSSGEIEIIELRSGDIVEQRFYMSEQMLETAMPFLEYRSKWGYNRDFFFFEKLCRFKDSSSPMSEAVPDYIDNYGATLEKRNGKIFICFSDDEDWNYYKAGNSPPAH